MKQRLNDTVAFILHTLQMRTLKSEVVLSYFSTTWDITVTTVLENHGVKKNIQYLRFEESYGYLILQPSTQKRAKTYITYNISCKRSKLFLPVLVTAISIR